MKEKFCSKHIKLARMINGHAHRSLESEPSCQQPRTKTKPETERRRDKRKMNREKKLKIIISEINWPGQCLFCFVLSISHSSNYTWLFKKITLKPVVLWELLSDYLKWILPFDQLKEVWDTWENVLGLCRVRRESFLLLLSGLSIFSTKKNHQ